MTKRTKPIRVMLTESEHAALKAAAAADNRSLAEWVRLVALEAAKER
jgi:uncharacterized protein (DUF1778 family)